MSSTHNEETGPQDGAGRVKDGRSERTGSAPPPAAKQQAIACSGEIDLTAAPVAPVGEGGGGNGSGLDGVSILRMGDGPVRCVKSDLSAEAVSGRAITSAILPSSAVAREPSSGHVGLPFSPLAPWPMIQREYGPFPQAMPPQHRPGKGNATLKELQRLHRLLRGRYVWAILLAIVFGAAGAALGYRAGSITYCSSGVIRIMPALRPVIAPHSDEASMMPMYETYVEAQVSLLKSQRVIEQALDEAAWRAAHGKANNLGGGIARFTDALQISRQGELIWVKSFNLEPPDSIAMVNATIDAYMKVYKKIEEETDNGRDAVRQQIQQSLRSDLQELDNQIQVLVKKYGTDDLKPLVEAKQAECTRLEEQVHEATAQLDKQNRIQQQPAPQPPAITRPEDIAFLYRDAHMMELLNYRTRCESDLAAIRRRSLPAKDDFKEAEARLKNAETEIALYTGRFVYYMQQSVDHADPREPKANLATLQQLLESTREEVRALGLQASRVAQLRQRAAETKGKLDEVTETINRIDVENRAPGRVLVMSHADQPLGPFKDTRISTGAAAGFGGIALGFGAMLLLGLFDGRLERPEDADAQLTNLPLLGLVPVLPDDLSHPEDAALAAHCVHEIRTRLQILGQGRPHPTFGITSPTAGSGKTSLTMALGLSFAAANLRTLLIDCDIVGGGLTRKFEAIARRRIGAILVQGGLITPAQLEEGLKLATRDGQPLGQALVQLGYVGEPALADAVALQSEEAFGLLDALDGEDVMACIAPTGIERLFVMPLGGATSHDAGGLSLAAFRRLLDRAARNFDVVIVDTGPVLGSLEASVVASQADAMVLAVAKGETKAMVERAMSHLASVGTNVAGMVFNRVRDRDVIAYSGSSSARSIASISAPGGDLRIERREIPGASRLGPVPRAVASWSPAGGLGSRRLRAREARRPVGSAD